MTDATYVTKVHGEGPDKLTIESGGTLEIVSGATVTHNANETFTGNVITNGTLTTNGTVTLANGASVSSGKTLSIAGKLTDSNTISFYEGNQFYRVAVAHIDTTVTGLTLGQHTSTIRIPNNAIVTKAWVNVTTQPTSTNSTAKLSIDLNVADDVVSNVVITNAQWTTGIKATIAAGAAANMIKMTAQRYIAYTVGIEAILGGVFDVYVEYMPAN